MSSFLRVMFSLFTGAMFSLFTGAKTKEEVKLGILLIQQELIFLSILADPESRKIREDEVKKLMDEYDLDCTTGSGIIVKRINNKIVFEY